MILCRPGFTLLIIALLECPSVFAQPGEDELPLSDRMFVATKIYSTIESYFAHRQGIAGLDLDTEYKTYLARAVAVKDRREFDLATLEFIAKLRNKHTQFDDQWLHRRDGQPLGFSVLPVEDKWVIGWSHDGRMEKADVVRAIDGLGIQAFIKDKQRFIAASSERGAQAQVFARPYLFPQQFTLELENGRQVVIDRKSLERNQTRETRPLAVEGRWLSKDSVGYVKVPSWNDSKYEKAALDWVRKLRGAKCLIVDVRDNGGGSTPFELIRELMNVEWRYWRTSTPSLVALHRAQGAPAAQLRMDSDRNRPRAGAFSGKLILLVDRASCSATEDFVMPFKDNGRADIIGETTEGSSGQPCFVNFDNGMRLMVGAARHSFPDGSPFESLGIEPTIPVALRLSDLRKGIDPVLQRAKLIAGIP
jgi:carboxyl-terminal processing protease